MQPRRTRRRQIRIRGLGLICVLREIRGQNCSCRGTVSGKSWLTRRMDASSVRVAAVRDGRTRRPSYEFAMFVRFDSDRTD